MIEEIGTVVSIHEHNIVEVETVRTSSCTACKAKAACGHHAIAQVSSSNRMRVFATDNFSTQIGQKVTIGIPENSLLSASILMYLIPLVGLIIGAALPSVLTEQSYIAAIFSIAGFITGLWIAKVQSGKYHSNPEFHPRVMGLYKPNPATIPITQF